MTDKKQKVVIIGGGITGLSAAFYLQKEMIDHDLQIESILIEASPRLGGKIQTVHKDGFIIERGPDSFLERKASAPQFVKDVGLQTELVNNATGRSFVLVGDRLHPIPAGAVMGIPTQVLPFVTTGLFSILGKARAAGDYILPAGRESGDQSLGHFFRRRLGNEVVENLIEPLLSGIYAGDIDKLSLMSTFPQFHRVEQDHRSLILGMKKGLPRANQKHDPARKKGIFQTVKGGLQTLVDAAERKLTNTKILKGVKVESITKKVVGYVLKLSNGDVIEADTLIVTTPHQQTANMLPDKENYHYLQEMPSTSVATVAMAFPEESIDIEGNGTGFVISRNGDYTITACTWTHRKWPHTVPAGKALIRAYVGKAGDQAIVEQPDHEIIAAVLEDLNKIMKIEQKPDFTVVSRWKEAMPQYNVGHQEQIQEIEEKIISSYPGVFLAGASYAGVGIPDCIDQGKIAVANALDYLKKATL
ncbi:protoporphyrinogen oxidase [Metabacillus idriensis]|uniref:protoporphyrinogen oxidase n=1 Tax=Metabacillus idriensis TaxID=324768 RepID=UPI00174ADEEC|nr:protoporphyrinogen oxidase [Metabacillus idriensis]